MKLSLIEQLPWKRILFLLTEAHISLRKTHTKFKFTSQVSKGV